MSFNIDMKMILGPDRFWPAAILTAFGPDRFPRLAQNDPSGAQTHKCGWSMATTWSHNSASRPPEREKQKGKWSGRGEKREILSPPPFGAPPFGDPSLRAPQFRQVRKGEGGGGKEEGERRWEEGRGGADQGSKGRGEGEEGASQTQQLDEGAPFEAPALPPEPPSPSLLPPLSPIRSPLPLFEAPLLTSSPLKSPPPSSSSKLTLEPSLSLPFEALPWAPSKPTFEARMCKSCQKTPNAHFW